MMQELMAQLTLKLSGVSQVNKALTNDNGKRVWKKVTPFFKRHIPIIL